MTAKSYPISEKRSKEVLELIYADITEFPINSYHQYKYSLCILDDYSSLGWYILLKHKNDAHQSFKDFITVVKRQTNKKVKRLCID